MLLAPSSAAALDEPVMTYRGELENVVFGFAGGLVADTNSGMGSCLTASGKVDDEKNLLIAIGAYQDRNDVTTSGTVLLIYAGVNQTGKSDDVTLKHIAPPPQTYGLDQPKYRFGARCRSSLVAGSFVVVSSDMDDSVAKLEPPTEAVFIFQRGLVDPDTFTMVAEFNSTVMAALFGDIDLVSDNFGKALEVDDRGIVFIGDGSNARVYEIRHNASSHGTWYVHAAHSSPSGYKDGFGAALAVSGNLLAVGRPYFGGLLGGVVVYEFNETSNEYELHSTLTLDSPEYSGVYLAGQVVGIDALAADSGASSPVTLAASLLSWRSSRGAVATYMWNETAGDWMFDALIEYPGAQPGDLFGHNLRMRNGTMAIFSILANNYQGYGHLYERTSLSSSPVAGFAVPPPPSPPPPAPSPPPAPIDSSPPPPVAPPQVWQTPSGVGTWLRIKELGIPPQFRIPREEPDTPVNFDLSEVRLSLFGVSVAMLEGAVVVGAPFASFAGTPHGAFLPFVTTSAGNTNRSYVDAFPRSRRAGAGAESEIRLAVVDDQDVLRRLGGDKVHVVVMTEADSLSLPEVFGFLQSGGEPSQLPGFVGRDNATHSTTTGLYHSRLSWLTTVGRYRAVSTIAGSGVIQGSGQTFEVFPDVLDGINSLVWGVGTDPLAAGAVVGEPLDVYAQARDTFGNNVTVASELGSGMALTVIGTSIVVSDIQVRYEGDGLYVATYTPTEPGTYTLTVTLDAQLAFSTTVTMLASCRPGTYAQTETGPCLICAPGEYSDSINAAGCTSCPAFTTTTSTNSSSIVACVCTPGFYSLTGGGVACEACMPFAECPGGTALPRAAKGAFQVDVTSFIRCDPEDACLGGMNSPCAPGYAGFACGVCIEGYYKVNGRCEACPQGHSWLLVVFVVLLVLACLAFTIVSVLMARRMTKDRRNRRTTWSLASIGAGITYMQILALLGELKAEWPSSVSSFLLSFSVVNFNIEFFAPECSVESSYASKYMLVMGVPLILGGVMAMVFGIVNVYASLRAGSPGVWDAEQLQFFNRKISVATVFTALPFLYISLTRSTLSHFSCIKREDGKWHMTGNAGLYCYDNEWWEMFPVAAAGTLLYVVGIPALFASVLFVRKHKLDRVSSLVRFGSIYRLYIDQFYYWELVMTGKKFSLVVLQLFFGSTILFQLVLLVALFSVAAMVQLKLQPFYRAIHNSLELALNVSVWARLESGAPRNAMIAVTLAIVIISMVILLASAIRELLFMYLLYKAGGDPNALPAFRRDEFWDTLRTWFETRGAPATHDDTMAMVGFVESRMELAENSDGLWEVGESTDGGIDAHKALRLGQDSWTGFDDVVINPVHDDEMGTELTPLEREGSMSHLIGTA
ncbi:uncharacterized protein AMSG_10453 [Thecamonas trahens ATCC 50062]|uniref:Tyrosine-protein kinase ephrin type A/B receptor-like domain-containing protein n=1 Tax=Thecamonas trahens ATCC 50062 TaxID=461836 RepID=A0A0L0DQ77_THETB|nr:hypothetical protein AMSG_10453 [Thecamonas trahens ATCC 50062]KNC54457.1 hypothetical protein AMSG_10453 [Thecamonas trahens ATCC 50062]|eukprot:XP_013753612.1 hypothetical protein AMSG_10453 [Thecamonas trahens ATCC 50062]